MRDRDLALINLVSDRDLALINLVSDTDLALINLVSDRDLALMNLISYWKELIENLEGMAFLMKGKELLVLDAADETGEMTVNP